MKTLRFAFLVLTSISAACAVDAGGEAEDSSGDPERGSVGKADGLQGSCMGDDGIDACGGPAAVGNCWCDDQCEQFGDCCADMVDVCEGGVCDIDPTTVLCAPDTLWDQEACACVPIVPEPLLCQSDESCGDGEVCDHTECLSPECPEGFACPAVCWGQCLPADEVCDIDPTTVLCGPDTLWNDEACACVPIVPEQCEPPTNDYVALTGAELFANPDAFVGSKVWLTGDAEVGFAICTQIACSPEFPCCNSCGAGIDMDLGAGELGMSGLGCGGNECTVLDNCDYSQGAAFTAWGTLQQSFGTLRLEVEGHCGV
jgi:hypothetical protein